MKTDTLLVIGFVWPEPKSTAAGSRMLQLIHLFLNQGYKITFASTAKKTPLSFPLEDFGVLTKTITLNNPSFDAFVKRLQPAVVLFDRFMVEEQFGWRVAEQCPNALRILDTEDFHGLRAGREEALKCKRPFGLEYLQNETTKREIASIYRCDLTLMISEVEIEILHNQLGVNTSLLFYLPFLIENTSQFTKQLLPKFNEREHFSIVGNFFHKPNYDAVEYLKQTLWPLIKEELPIAELHVYGAYTSKKVNQLHNKKQGFIVKGFVNDINAVLQNSRVCLAPLRFGAGLKGKLIDAMKNGTPCIMTSVAAEGMFNTQILNDCIKDGDYDFAKAAVNLYTNSGLWKTKSSHGFKVLKQRFDVVHFEKNFNSKINDLKVCLPKHRRHNFIGQMIQHQSLQSTKYLSKWIEEKQKKHNK